MAKMHQNEKCDASFTSSSPLVISKAAEDFLLSVWKQNIKENMLNCNVKIINTFNKTTGRYVYKMYNYACGSA